jgi:RHS repeat-associated protein
MPDSRQMLYLPKLGGGYTSWPGDLNTLEKLSTNKFELTTPTGEVLVYDGVNSSPLLGAPLVTLVKIKDRLGYSIDLDFDEDGRITTVTDAQGKETKLFYEDEDHELAVTRIKDPFGRQAHFQYDAMGNMVRVTDMEGAAANYTYTGFAVISEIETGRGSWNFTHAQTYLGWPHVWNSKISVTDPLGKTEEFFWVGEMADPGHVQYTDKRGAITRYYSRQTVGNVGKITQVVAPDNSTTNLTYDFWTAKPATITDPKGRVTRLTYNPKGRVTTATDPKGRVTTYQYANNGIDLLSVTNSRNEKIVSATYNNDHQPLWVTQDPDNLQNLQGTSTFTYTAWGAPATVTDAEGDQTVYSYDVGSSNTKRLLSVAREGVTMGTLTYDRMGRVRSVTDVSNLTTTYDYNDLNRVERVTYPDGTYAEQDSSCCGLAGTVTDRAGRKSYTDYDAMKRPVRVQDASGQVVQVAYDPNGNLSQILDAKGNVTSFEYDSLNRLVRKAYSNHTTETFAYDEVGNLIAARDARGRLTKYTYDALTDDLLKIDYETMADVTFAYDDLGQMTSMSDALGSGSALFGYDLLGRVKYENQPWDNDTVNWGYDKTGRRIRTSIGYGGYDVVTFFDGLGRPDYLTSPAGTFNYNYSDNSSHLESLYPPNASRLLFQYDSLGRLKEVANRKSNGQNIALFEYGFDASNQPQRDVRTRVDKTMGAGSTQRTSFGYDAVDQLTSQLSNETPTPLLNHATAFDAMGNRTAYTNTTPTNVYSSSYTSNRLNQYTQIQSSWDNGASTSTSALSYDAGGNLLKHTASATGNGSPSHVEYVYDDLDRLTQVLKKDPTTLANLSKSEYTYDGFSRLRVSREFTWNGTGWDEQYAQEKRRIYDGLDVIREQNVWGGNIATYIRDGNIGGLLSKEDGVGYRYFYHYDGSGNVVAMTDQQENVVAEYTYDAWGVLLSSTGAQAASNTYRFATKEHFAGSGFYNYGYRFYSPGMGRWINRDPIGEAGGLNLYAAFANSPTNQTDARGLYVESLIDLGFIAWDIYEIIQNPCDKMAWAALAADGAGLAAPGFTGGGLAVRAAAHADDTVKFVRHADDAVDAARHADDIYVIGRRWDTKVAEAWPGHEVLNVPVWNLKVNDQWIQTGIDKSAEFYLASPVDLKHLRNLEHSVGDPRRRTIFLRELKQLRAAGYKRVPGTNRLIP